MHPRMFHARASRCGCGGRCDAPSHHHHFNAGEELGAGGFGVRRPLRFLAWKLQLDERQVAELARVLSELKTERAQAAVDDRRALSLFADAAAGESFDQAKAAEAAKLRVQSAERLQGSVARFLERTHATLDAEQRERLAYLIRTGTLVL
jgi:Spy/CpxP family protein refolding chaperone